MTQPPDAKEVASVKALVDNYIEIAESDDAIFDGHPNKLFVSADVLKRIKASLEILSTLLQPVVDAEIKGVEAVARKVIEKRINGDDLNTLAHGFVAILRKLSQMEAMPLSHKWEEEELRLLRRIESLIVENNQLQAERAEWLKVLSEEHANGHLLMGKFCSICQQSAARPAATEEKKE